MKGTSRYCGFVERDDPRVIVSDEPRCLTLEWLRRGEAGPGPKGMWQGCLTYRLITCKKWYDRLNRIEILVVRT